MRAGGPCRSAQAAFLRTLPELIWPCADLALPPGAGPVPSAPPPTDVTVPLPRGALLRACTPTAIFLQEVPVQQGLLRRHMGTEQYGWRLALEPRLAHRPGLHAEQKVVWPPASAGPRLHCVRYLTRACPLSRRRWPPSVRSAAQTPRFSTLTRLSSCLLTLRPLAGAPHTAGEAESE